MKEMKQYRERSGEIIAIRSLGEVQTCARSADGELALRIPAHWAPTPLVNVFAGEVEAELLEWFRQFGFGERAMETLRSFAPGHYAGVPFPRAGQEDLLRIAKYLSLWLLWDDVNVETSERGFRLRARDVLDPHADPPENLFDRAWWCLFRELSGVQSAAWMDALIDTMHQWSQAALEQARLAKFAHDGHVRLTFPEVMRARVATIGMYTTSYLIEHARRVELPREFHAHPAVRKITTTASEIVGLGNDLFSLGKDMATGYVNVVLALRGDLSISLGEAIRQVVFMHNDTLLQFDRLVQLLPSFGKKHEEAIAGWLRDLRYACVGFTMWESQAPRYAAFKLLVDDVLVEPYFVIQSGTSHRGPTPSLVGHI